MSTNYLDKGQVGNVMRDKNFQKKKLKTQTMFRFLKFRGFFSLDAKERF
jgi:hypothetical protein